MPLTTLVTGATGHIGSRLVPRLLEEGYLVRCFVRDPSKLQSKPWREQVDVVRGDALDYDSVWSAMEAMDTCYYLIHAFGERASGFAEHDRHAASNFGKAARERGLSRLIYLGTARPGAGGLAPNHIVSRIETGVYLRRWGVPVTEFRAAPIIGTGSPAFVLIQHLTERLPVLICPRWMFTRIQPLSTRTVLDYLTAALTTEKSTGVTIELGGAEVVTFADLLQRYAERRGLRRLLVSIPLNLPYLSAFILGRLTPLSSQRALFLIEQLRVESMADVSRAEELFSIRPPAADDVLRAALGDPEDNQPFPRKHTPEAYAP